jgi:hypothetical protein
MLHRVRCEEREIRRKKQNGREKKGTKIEREEVKGYRETERRKD